MHIYLSMCDVIKHRSLNLIFEHENEVWPYHLFECQVHKKNDGELLLNNYKPCDELM